MSPIMRSMLALMLIIFGINLLANNTLDSILSKNFFNKDPFSIKAARFMGLLMTISAFFLLLNMPQITLMIDSFVILVLMFLMVRGMNNAYAARESRKAQLLKEYQDEILSKKRRIVQLKNRHRSDDETSNSSKKHGKSVQDIKKELWNNGSLTNKELIKGFKESDK